MDPRKHTPKHIRITLPKIKDKRNLKAARGKERVIYKGAPKRPSADFSKETLQARRGWKEVFQVMKSKDLKPRLLYPTTLSLKIEGEIRSFPDKKELKGLVNMKLVLEHMLKDLQKEEQGEEEIKNKQKKTV